LECEGVNFYCSKPYGLELLLILEKCKKEGVDNGIEDTFDLILFNKPRRAAFAKFIKQLEELKYIIKQKSSTKASKFVLRMSAETAKSFTKFKVNR